ncbi:sodium/solute symporter [candidate division KSB1 bacterium]|nr:sodium/solute symporter [candidate division KSB1 bacterium]
MRRLPILAAWLVLLLSPICSHSTEHHPNLRWSPLSSLPMAPEHRDDPRVVGAFGGISNDVLICAGGASGPEGAYETGERYYDDLFILDLTDGLDSLRWSTRDKLDRPIAYGASVSTPHGLLCMGGRDAEQIFASVLLLSWDSQRKELVRTDLPSLPQPCAHGCAALLDNHVYLAGGQSTARSTSAMKNFWRLDLSLLTKGDSGGLAWEELPPWPGPARAHNITIAQHNGQAGCIYVISGRCGKEPSSALIDDLLTDVYEFNPARYHQSLQHENGWRRRRDLPASVVAGKAAALGQSHILILAGAANFHRQDERSSAAQNMWLFHAITDTWIEGGSTPIDRISAGIVNWGDHFIIPGSDARQDGGASEVWLVQPEQKSSYFGILNFATLILYLSSMMLIGFYFSRRNKNTNDYFRGGQRVPWWAAACSIFATMLSSITYMSVPAKAYAANWEYLLGYPAIFITAAIVVHFVLPFFRRIDATSAYEYLEKRFNRLTRQVGSGLFVFFQIGRMAIVMYLSALALAAITPFSEVEGILIMGVLSILYSTLGGVEAVIWTDTIQTFILLGGALLIFSFALINIDGGIAAFLTTAAAQDKFHMVNWEWDVHSYTRAAFWVLVIGSLAQNLISYTSDQAVVQRYMTTASEKLASRSIWTNGIMSLFAGLLFFLIGAALFVFYQTYPTHLDPTFKNDAIMPLFIVSELSVGIAGLLVAGIFAAAQSTISTSMNSAASAIVIDFIRLFVRDQSDRYYLHFGRLSTFCIGLAGTVIAISLASADIRSLLDQFFAFIGLFGGSLGGLFLLGMFTRRATGRGAFAGAIIGAVALYLVQSKTDTHVYLYAFVGIAACFIGGYVSSLLLGGATSNIDGLTIYDLQDRRKGAER